MAFRGSFSKFCFGGAFTAAGLALRKATQFQSQHLLLAKCDGESDDHGVPDKVGGLEVDREAMPNVVEYAWKKRVSGLSYKYQTMRCVDVVEIAPDVKIFRFALPNPEDTFTLPPCSTVQCRIWTGTTAVDNVERFYTPCTPNGAKGHFDLIVRNHYGKMTTPLFKLKVGETMDFRAIMFKLKYKPNKWDDVGMIAGGSGVTPMLQLIRQILPMGLDDPYYELIKGMQSNHFTQSLNAGIDPEQSADRTRISMLFANRDESSVFLREYLDKLHELRPERFKVKYVINHRKPDSKWDGYVGYITKDMVTSCFPEPKKNKNILLLCGPDAMITHLCGGGAAVMGTMHMGSHNNGGLRSQGAGADYVNNIPISGMLGELGYDQDTCYRF
jgi:cytochrome-b5 reductase